MYGCYNASSEVAAISWNGGESARIIIEHQG